MSKTNGIRAIGSGRLDSANWIWSMGVDASGTANDPPYVVITHSTCPIPPAARQSQPSSPTYSEKYSGN